MKYVRLGCTGLKVSPICLGTNMFGAGYVDDDRAELVIHKCLDEGINFFDTADVYHSGLSEKVVGQALKGRRNEAVIATKGWAPMGLGVNDQGLSRKHLIDAVDASLMRLDTDYIDLYQVHGWDLDTPMEETLWTLDNLVRQGKIRYLGCSNFAAWQLIKALWVSDKNGFLRFESVQPPYNFSRRYQEDELFPLCEDQQVAVLPFQVLMGGILTARYDGDCEPPDDSHMASVHAQGAKRQYWDRDRFDMAQRVKVIADKLGHQPTQVVIAWALSRPAVTSVIVGASRVEQVVSNAYAASICLDKTILEQLDCL